MTDEGDIQLVSAPSAKCRIFVASLAAVGIFFLLSNERDTVSLWTSTSPLTSVRNGVAAASGLGKYVSRPTYLQHTQVLQNQILSEGNQNSSATWSPNALLGTATGAGLAVGAGLMAIFQRITKDNAPASETWSITAVADANLDMQLDKVQFQQEEHLPPWAGDAPYRPDLFQPIGQPGTIALTDIKYIKKRKWWFPRAFDATDIVFLLTVGGIHAAAFILGPMTYRPDCLALAAVMYVVTGLFGITLSFHRQLSHRSFTTPKWLEYLFAYCGVLAIQGDPLEWVASHRYHHLYCETDRDPHTVNEGLWWSHMGWLLDHEATKARTGDQSNANDIAQDPFYIFIKKTYPLHPLLFACAMYAWGGLPYLVWGVAVRTVWVWHITWFVNSASHAWGKKAYRTNPPDESRNNWWVGILAFGEGWHNNHHAFQFSARHGLEWWQVDMTYYVIRALQFVGLASNVKLPTEAKKQAMRLA